MTITHKDAKKAEVKKSAPKDISDKEGTKGDPRGDDEDLNTPEPSGEPIVPASHHTPHNPSDYIEDQIEATDAKTKRPGTEFEKGDNETAKDYAIRLGVDGNDGLSDDEIYAKIAAFQGKRMFDKPRT